MDMNFTLSNEALIFLAVTSITLVLMRLAHWLLFINTPSDSDHKIPRYLTLIGIYIAGILAIALALPVVESTRNQIIGLIGILLSGVIAFSSTSIVGNVMAGLVMRITKPFRAGDFIHVNGYFGRVSERGLFDTEIQTEQRELVSFTNAMLLTHPIKVIRSSGTIVAADITLGYEVHHAKVKEQLLAAAESANLSEPFVQVIELGNYAVHYRVAGLLTEVKSLLSARSSLHCAILDHLHNADIEIVSPNFMNTRNISDSPPVLSKTAASHQQEKLEDEQPEAIIFDKAEQAEQEEQAQLMKSSSKQA